VLGERFVGMDNGEQDGRYLSYAPGQYRGRGGGPKARASELRQSFLHFGEFFDRMADDLGNKQPGASLPLTDNRNPNARKDTYDYRCHQARLD
jgi:hypothetical protein